MPRTKQRTPELRNDLVDVAAGLLAAEGTAGFTARRIAAEAGTSPPAIYELFGDKAGLLRALFFRGFESLGFALAEVPEAGGREDGIVELASVYRRFMLDHRILSELMFSRPFAEFEPDADERAAGAAVRERIVGEMQAASSAGTIGVDPVDAAHVLVATIQGLAFAEQAERFGSSPGSTDRRFELAIRALIAGMG